MTSPFRKRTRRLSPDGPDHWPVFLGRLKPMWNAEPSFTYAELQRITAATLIIVGDRDIVRPEHAIEMFRTIPEPSSAWSRTPGTGSCPRRRS